MAVKSLAYDGISRTFLVVSCVFERKETDLTQSALRSEGPSLNSLRTSRGRREERCALGRLKVAATFTSPRGSCSFCFGRRARFSVGRNNRLTRLRRVRAGRSGFPALRPTACFRRG